ncbi:TPA: type II secretion system protein [Escherichia coli]|nr:type II secretion system protein [Escherichia coli]
MRKNKEKGLSLIESAMVLALAAVVTSGVLFYYNYAKEKNEIKEGTAQLQVIIAAINKLYSNGTSSFPTGSDLSSVVKAVSAVTGISTVTYTNNGDDTGQLALKSPVGNGVKFYGVTNGVRQYRIAVQPKNVSSCIAYATLNLGTAMYKKPIVSADGISGNAKLATDISKATALCKQEFSNADAAVSVVFHMRY